MDFEQDENVTADDLVISVRDDADAAGSAEPPFRLACDPKSLLYLFGLQLDYSGALIGGGFQFQNPNAESSCGCGKSFGV